MRCPPLLLTLLLVPAAVAQEPAPFADPSFEGEAPAWKLGQHVGAEGSLLVADQGRTGRCLRLEKFNGLGFLALTARFAQVPGTSYELAVHLRFESFSYGTKAYFANIEYGADDQPIYPVNYSPRYLWRAVMLPGESWQRHTVRWTAKPGATSTLIQFVLTGNPAVVYLDDVELIANPPEILNKGQANSLEPVYDEARARANLARRVAEPGRVETVAGRPMFAVGQGYRSAFIHQGAFWSPDRSRYAGFGRAGLHLQTVAVQMGPYPDLAQNVWKYPNGFDFSPLEGYLLRAVGADPEVRVILLVRCDAPRPWTQAHLDHVWTAESGQRWVCGDGMHPSRTGDLTGDKDIYLASYGSPLYQADMEQALRRLGEYLKASEVGKLVVGFMVGGNNDGQFFPGSLNQELDHSPGNQMGFRLWLKQHYGTVDKLRAAWADPAVTFATATLAPEASRKVAAAFLGKSGADRRAADSNRYDGLAPVSAIQRFARALKESLGRPAFAITYWSDAAHDQGGNRYALADLMSGPDKLDAAASVHDYGEWRALGGTGGVNACWAAHKVRGTVLIGELDYRTYRSYMAGMYGPEMLGAPMTAEGFRAQARRDVGAAASRGMGLWYYDMSGGWYDDPRLWPVIAESERILAWAHRPEAPSATAGMAVFVDEQAGWRISTDRFHLLNQATKQTREPLNLSGVPYDLYLLDDLRNPALPDYRMYVFLTSYCLDRAQVEAIRRICLRPGRVTLFQGAPGLGSTEFASSPELFRELTGLSCDLRPAGAKAACVAEKSDDPVARELDPAYLGDGPLVAEALVPTAPGMVVLGRFADDRQPSHGLARTERGTIALAAVALTPRLLHNLAVEAGIRTLGTPEQVIYVGSGVAVAHRVRPGPLAVEFAAPVDLLDTDGTTVLARKLTRWSPECKLLDTAAVLYRPAG